LRCRFRGRRTRTAWEKTTGWVAGELMTGQAVTVMEEEGSNADRP
jgi:hypothetical protein